MADPTPPKPAASRLKSARPRPISPSAESLTRSWVLSEADGLPLVFEPAAEQLELAGWAAGRTDELRRQLLRHGALLFRGFRVGGAAEFEQFARAFSPELLDYKE